MTKPLTITLWNAQSQGIVINKIKKLPADGSIVVVIKKREEDRTIAQNRLMWLWFGVIGDEIGYTKQEVHDAMCREILGVDVRRDLKGEPFETIKGTRGLGIKGMTAFLGKVDYISGGLGITLPHPEDIYYQAMGYSA